MLEWVALTLGLSGLLVVSGLIAGMLWEAEKMAEKPNSPQDGLK